MNLDLTSDQKMIQETLRKFAVNELDPVANEMDKNREFPLKLLEKLASLGVTSLTIPEDCEKAEIDTVSLVVALEELSKYWASVAFIILNHNISLYPLAIYSGQNEKLVEEMSSAKKLGAFAFLEPYGGLDILKIETKAQLRGTEYFLTGRKVLVPGGEKADNFLIAAKLENGKPGCFLVEKSNLKVTPQPDLLGMKGALCANIILDNSKGTLVGKIEDGEKIFLKILDLYRLGLATIAVGLSQRTFERSIQYSKERKQFGSPIGKFPMVQEKGIKMAWQTASARLLIYDTALKSGQGKAITQEAALALLSATQIAIQSTTDGVQIHGGNGYTKDYPMERYMRDAQVLRMAGGTVEVLSNCVAQEIWS